MTDTSIVWRHRGGWAVRLLPGRVVMARPGGERRTLEGLGAAVWVALGEPSTAAEVRRWIHSEVPDAELDQADVDETIDMLADAGVIEPSGPEPSGDPR